MSYPVNGDSKDRHGQTCWIKILPPPGERVDPIQLAALVQSLHRTLLQVSTWYDPKRQIWAKVIDGFENLRHLQQKKRISIDIQSGVAEKMSWILFLLIRCPASHSNWSRISFKTRKRPMNGKDKEVISELEDWLPISPRGHFRKGNEIGNASPRDRL